jgi:hypothetical protein
MFGWDDARDAHQQVYGDGGYENQAKFSHELIAGGAAFEGMKLYEDHQRKEGKNFHSRQSIARLSNGLSLRRLIIFVTPFAAQSIQCSLSSSRNTCYRP